jgi:hypothetical protein
VQEDISRVRGNGYFLSVAFIEEKLGQWNMSKMFAIVLNYINVH